MANEESRLVELLEEVIVLLDGEELAHWRLQFERGRQQVTARDPYGLATLLNTYGGMGSFNDLVLEDRAANARLAGLRSAIYDETRELARDVRREDRQAGARRSGREQ